MTFKFNSNFDAILVSNSRRCDAAFAYVPQKGRQAYMINGRRSHQSLVRSLCFGDLVVSVF